jgi:hypothetical protein
MMNDLASATSSPPAEFTSASYLTRNYLEYLYLLYFGSEDHVWFEDRWTVASWCDE